MGFFCLNNKRGVFKLITLTKTEIRWILNLVIESRESSKILKDYPGQKYAALHELEYEKMATLAEKLETVLKSNSKRIAVKGW